MIDPKIKVATGFYVVWDLVSELDERLLDWAKKQEKTKPKTDFSARTLLSSLNEAAYTFRYALETGGREYLITKELHAQLKNVFRFEGRRLGGNGYHMGKTLYDLGVIPLVSYPCRPKLIMDASPNFKIASRDGFITPKQAARENDPEYEHLIIELNEDKHAEVRVSGRQIYSYDLMSFEGKFDSDFFYYGFNRKYIEVLIIAYAHLLLPERKNRTNLIVDHLSTGKRPKVHLEFGDGSDESTVYAIRKFSDFQCSDSWGFNEKECKKYLKAESEDLGDLKKVVLEAVKKYGLERICVHTPKFVFSISKYNAEKEKEALLRGVLASAALTMGDLIQNLKHASKLPKSKVETRVENISGGYHFCLIPTYINKKPKILTGLGDTFAAVQATIALG